MKRGRTSWLHRVYLRLERHKHRVVEPGALNDVQPHDAVAGEAIIHWVKQCTTQMGQETNH